MINKKKVAIRRGVYLVALTTFIFYINDCVNSIEATPKQKMVLLKSNFTLSDKIAQPKLNSFTAQKTRSRSTEINPDRARRKNNFKQPPQYKASPSNSSPRNSSFVSVNSHVNYEWGDNDLSTLQENEDLIDLLDGEDEETIAYAFDIGLELDFFELEEQLNDDLNNVANKLSGELEMTTNLNDTSFAANQLRTDISNKILSADSNFEDSVEYIKQLSSLTSQQSESDELIIMTLNDLTEDADFSISDAAFEGLETLIATQQNESVPDFEMENVFINNELY